IARNSQGETISITALIKTQGSDTKLVAQMQPYYEAKTLNKQQLGDVLIPPIVTQIGDGENGGVMMNEFPGGFKQAWWDMLENGGGKSGVVGVCGTEYLELLEVAGCQPEDFPQCQPIGQHQIWQRIATDNYQPDAVENAIQAIKKTNPNFHVDGASWTNHISWVQGYENVLSPMYELSNLFHQKFDHLLSNTSDKPVTRETHYRQVLLHNLLLQTSCFRYWGQGAWTDYAKEIYQSGQNLLEYPPNK
ncbi:MAG: glycosyl hydrolase family 57, partial [Sphaerospermopsis sp.]|nr:glycosyl hydrolase family 57 [Sphaerospermopsis sp.]